MTTTEEGSRSRAARGGWGILIAVSCLLIFAGIGWFGSLPRMALENIAEYASLDSGVFMQGEPSSFVVITLIARGYGAGYAALGLLALLVSLEGYRNGTRWAWTALWVLVAAYAAMAVIFLLAGETYALSFGILGIALIALVGLLLTRKDLSLQAGEKDSSKG